MESSLKGVEGSDEASDLGSGVVSSVDFFWEVWVPRWAPRKGIHSEIHGVLAVVWVEVHPPRSISLRDKLSVASRYPCCPILCPLCRLTRHGEANGSTPPSYAV